MFWLIDRLFWESFYFYYSFLLDKIYKIWINYLKISFWTLEMTDKISITFDDENRIRVLEADKFKDTETMRNESMEFIKSDFI